MSYLAQRIVLCTYILVTVTEAKTLTKSFDVIFEHQKHVLLGKQAYRERDSTSYYFFLEYVTVECLVINQREGLDDVCYHMQNVHVKTFLLHDYFMTSLVFRRC